jgi:hypothetical protein
MQPVPLQRVRRHAADPGGVRRGGGGASGGGAEGARGGGQGCGARRVLSLKKKNEIIHMVETRLNDAGVL